PVAPLAALPISPGRPPPAGSRRLVAGGGHGPRERDEQGKRRAPVVHRVLGRRDYGSWIWSRYRRAPSRACTKAELPSSFFGKKSKYSRQARLALFITAGCFVIRYSLWYESAV